MELKVHTHQVDLINNSSTLILVSNPPNPATINLQFSISSIGDQTESQLKRRTYEEAKKVLQAAMVALG
jgi:hypothetical protein